MLLEADVLMDSCFVRQNEGAEWELELLGWGAVGGDHLEKLAEKHSHLFLFFMPPGNVLRNLSALNLMLFVESSETGVYKLALGWLFSKDVDG